MGWMDQGAGETISVCQTLRGHNSWSSLWIMPSLKYVHITVNYKLDSIGILVGWGIEQFTLLIRNRCCINIEWWCTHVIVVTTYNVDILLRSIPWGASKGINSQSQPQNQNKFNDYKSQQKWRLFHQKLRNMPSKDAPVIAILGVESFLS